MDILADTLCDKIKAHPVTQVHVFSLLNPAHALVIFGLINNVKHKRACSASG